jgi:hypothetical protein
LRPAWATQEVPGKPGLHSETLSQKEKKEKTKQNKNPKTKSKQEPKQK